MQFHPFPGRGSRIKASRIKASIDSRQRQRAHIIVTTQTIELRKGNGDTRDRSAQKDRANTCAEEDTDKTTLPRQVLKNFNLVHIIRHNSCSRYLFTCVAQVGTLIVRAVARLGQNNQLQGVEVLPQRFPGVQSRLERGPRVRLAPEGKHLSKI